MRFLGIILQMLARRRAKRASHPADEMRAERLRRAA